MTGHSKDMSETQPRTLSQEIDGLLNALTSHSLTLRDIMTVFKGRAYTLLLILISLPFCLPIPLMGLSTVTGSIVALIGLRLSLRLDPWLPDRLLDAPISAVNIARILNASKKTARVLERLLKPRWCFLVDWVVLHHFYGAMICISGVLLLLPLPIPLSNVLPGLTIIFLAAALLERDGYFIVAGIIMFVLTCAFFVGIYFGGAAAMSLVKEWFGDWLFKTAEQ